MPSCQKIRYKGSRNDLRLKDLEIGPGPKVLVQYMEINMTSLSLARWVTLGALLLAMCGAFSRSANGQTQSSQPADQKITDPAADQKLMAKANVLSFAPVPATTNTTTTNAAPPSPSSGFNWTGFYVGLNIGHGANETKASDNPLPTAAIFVNLLPQTFSLDPSGAVGGGQIGYNWQHGHFVLGLEGDIDAAGIDGIAVQSPIIQNNNTPFPGAGNNIMFHYRTDAVSTVRPRLGFVLGSRFLIYGTGGLAIAHNGFSANTDFRSVGTEQYPANFSKIQKGWAAGGGVEVAVAWGWTVRADYIRYDVGSLPSVTANPVPPLPPFQVIYTSNTDSANLVRFGVNYKF
jgi:outer membrane immunogenic protein